MNQYVKRLEDLIQCLIDNDPEDLAADGGIRVIDVWRKDAERALRTGKASEVSDDRPRAGGLVSGR
jgi:hypothetical protein